jgi:anthranilate/para-aminobenzoate synthase component II
VATVLVILEKRIPIVQLIADRIPVPGPCLGFQVILVAIVSRENLASLVEKLSN